MSAKSCLCQMQNEGDVEKRRLLELQRLEIDDRGIGIIARVGSFER